MVKYIGENNYEHGSKEKTGVLITNLGTPDEPNSQALKIYLKHVYLIRCIFKTYIFKRFLQQVYPSNIHLQMIYL